MEPKDGNQRKTDPKQPKKHLGLTWPSMEKLKGKQMTNMGGWRNLKGCEPRKWPRKMKKRRNMVN